MSVRHPTIRTYGLLPGEIVVFGGGACLEPASALVAANIRQTDLAMAA